MKILAKLFWRIILPFALALMLAITEILEVEGNLRGRFFSGSLSLDLAIVLFCVSFGTGLWNTLRWGKEAEEYEAELKEADEIEKERRRRANWIER